MKKKLFLRWIIGTTLLLVFAFFIASVPNASAAPKQAATPILLVVNSAVSNKFGNYYGEILRAEGLNFYETIDLNGLSDGTLSASLATHDIAILAETSLTSSQADIITNAVNSNNLRLLAMRPDSKIAGLFGLGFSSSTQNNGYVKIDDTVVVNGLKPGSGLNTATLQIHGATDKYSLSGGTVVAKLYSDASTDAGFPAVVITSTGKAAAFLYDLASNVIYTRQGNPANADIDVDGDGTVRTVDLFQKVGDSANPWVDRNKIPIPQADVQQRFFARLVRTLLNDIMPLPQLWYFPGTAKTMLIITGDAHGQSIAQWSNEVTSTHSYQAKASFFLAMAGDLPSNTGVMDTWIASPYYDTFGLHPLGKVGGGVPLATGFANADSQWKFLSPLPASRSRVTRIHRLEWEGWTVAPELMPTYDIHMDTSFYHYGWWLKNGVSWPHGYITGSGQPMKFITSTTGTVLNVYQQTTQIVDEELLAQIYKNQYDATTCDTNVHECLDTNGALTVAQNLIDASIAGDYAALTAMFHVDYYGFGAVQPWAEGVMNYATTNLVPMWNADCWLDFVDARHNANLTSFSWTPYTLNFTMNPAATSCGGTANAYTIMVPASYLGHAINSITAGGSSVTYSLQTINGTSMAFAPVTGGTKSVVVVYNSATAVELQNFQAHGEPVNELSVALFGSIAMILGSIVTFQFWKHRRN